MYVCMYLRICKTEPIWLCWRFYILQCIWLLYSCLHYWIWCKFKLYEAVLKNSLFNQGSLSKNLMFKQFINGWRWMKTFHHSLVYMMKNVLKLKIILRKLIADPKFTRQKDGEIFPHCRIHFICLSVFYSLISLQSDNH